MTCYLAESCTAPLCVGATWSGASGKAANVAAFDAEVLADMVAHDSRDVRASIRRVFNAWTAKAAAECPCA